MWQTRWVGHLAYWRMGSSLTGEEWEGWCG